MASAITICPARRPGLFPGGPRRLLGKLFGKTGALRAGAGISYDRFGSDLITQYDQFGSIGLATAGNFPDSYSFSTSPRFGGAAPGLPAPPAEFPVYRPTSPPSRVSSWASRPTSSRRIPTS